MRIEMLIALANHVVLVCGLTSSMEEETLHECIDKLFGMCR